MKKLKEGQKLLYKGKSCEFVEYDEAVYGMIWIKFENPIRTQESTMFKPFHKVDEIGVLIDEVTIKREKQ